MQLLASKQLQSAERAKLSLSSLEELTIVYTKQATLLTLHLYISPFSVLLPEQC